MNKGSSMPHLTYGLENPRDLFEKLKRDGQNLEQGVNSDRFFNFVITAYHICDWIKNNPNIRGAIKDDVDKTVRKDRNIAICKDITNASKHFKLNYDDNVAKNVDSKRGYGTGRYGRGNYGEGEEGINIALSDGSVINALELKNSVIKLWTSFFDEHNL